MAVKTAYPERGYYITENGRTEPMFPNGTTGRFSGINEHYPADVLKNPMPNYYVLDSDGAIQAFPWTFTDAVQLQSWLRLNRPLPTGQDYTIVNRGLWEQEHGQEQLGLDR